jgi:L-lactate utilization protein LutC
LHLDPILSALPTQQLILSNHPICRRLREPVANHHPEILIHAEPPAFPSESEKHEYRKKLAQIPLAVTGADFLIADTGTVVLFGSEIHHRQTSLLPQVHVVLGQPHQLLPDLSSCTSRLLSPPFSAAMPNAITLITGPSRTADIEKKLIKGVHGPQRLIVMLWP